MRGPERPRRPQGQVSCHSRVWRTREKGRRQTQCSSPMPARCQVVQDNHPLLVIMIHNDRAASRVNEERPHRRPACALLPVFSLSPPEGRS